MPSPFPGMDPFIEGQAWEEFHTAFIVTAHAGNSDVPVGAALHRHHRGAAHR
jgi:hypothetical protein